MNYIKHLRGFFERVEEDEKITAHHISLYMAIFHHWNINRFRKEFDVNRMDLMGFSRIGSTRTYARCMKQLTEWGYVHYHSNSNRYRVSKVSCIRFDTANATASNTTSEPATATTSDPLFINSSNNTNYKLYHKIDKNGKGRRIYEKDRLHISTQKDYSEPL